MHVLSEKQIRSLNEATKSINIWCGAIRSGKSFVALLKFLEFCLYGPKGLMAILGVSQRTIKQNVISMLYFLVGDDMQYKSGSGEIDLYGRVIKVIGANDERAEGKVRGATFACALVDEATLIPQSVFMTLVDRLSIPGAQLFATTNPDSPFHWLKTNFIDRKDELDLGYWDFYLEDNPSLEPDYVNKIKKINTGLWYKRKIAAQWVMAEGAVFSNFNKTLHVIEELPGLGEEFYIGIDYGTTNPTAFVLVAYNPNVYPNLWVEKEYYWNSAKMGKQKTDAQYAKDLKDFIGDFPIDAIYLDPSASSFKAELREQNFKFPVLDASNEVLAGIRRHATLLDEGTLKIHASCCNLISEYTLYTWDETYQKKGIDRPKKEFDHALDALRYVLLSRFAFEVKPNRRSTAPNLFFDPMGDFFSNKFN